ncbi:prephenate dehydratase [Methanogenium organophilum]|uniref:ACT domain-containing protein n=1 Tax=Methanogenium organophilum TaxID=2199 RepID=A0A9X9S5R4_METOG|nr:prephenate dehydratase domain-containing protein [Methanogenium organophilum]WAI01933.1 ACT domain-containing protein [Methanogenium organophilum]
MSLCCLGPEGTFSHEMARLLSDEDSDDILLLPTVTDVFRAVTEGRCDGVVPVENSDAGAVGPVMDGLSRFTVVITGEAYLSIHHHFAATVPAAEITTLYAHPQAHDQCLKFIDRLGVAVIHTESNSASAAMAAAHPGSGAITTEAAARMAGLPLRERDVQNTGNNTTRFLRISTRRPQTRPETGKCSLIIDPATDRPGLLYELLGVFDRQGLNLTRIESRPSKRGMGNYIFFVDVEIAPGLTEALEAVGGIASVKDLGWYGRLGEGV